MVHDFQAYLVQREFALIEFICFLSIDSQMDNPGRSTAPILVMLNLALLLYSMVDGKIIINASIREKWYN